MKNLKRVINFLMEYPVSNKEDKLLKENILSPNLAYDTAYLEGAEKRRVILREKPFKNIAKEGLTDNQKLQNYSGSPGIVAETFIISGGFHGVIQYYDKKVQELEGLKHLKKSCEDKTEELRAILVRIEGNLKSLSDQHSSPYFKFIKTYKEKQLQRKKARVELKLESNSLLIEIKRIETSIKINEDHIVDLKEVIRSKTALTIDEMKQVYPISEFNKKKTLKQFKIIAEMKRKAVADNKGTVTLKKPFLTETYMAFGLDKEKRDDIKEKKKAEERLKKSETALFSQTVIGQAGAYLIPKKIKTDRPNSLESSTANLPMEAHKNGLTLESIFKEEQTSREAGNHVEDSGLFNMFNSRSGERTAPVSLETLKKRPSLESSFKEEQRTEKLNGPIKEKNKAKKRLKPSGTTPSIQTSVIQTGGCQKENRTDRANPQDHSTGDYNLFTVPQNVLNNTNPVARSKAPSDTKPKTRIERIHS